MALYWLYRKNGGEVMGISVEADAYANVDATYLGVATDPGTPDGASLQPAKIWDSPNVRNATAPEIAAFPAAEATDTNLQNRQKAKDFLDTHPTTRKVLRSLVEVIIDEINVLRTLPAIGLPERTLAQAKTEILNKIDAGGND
jgi:hypothetical protein